MNILIVDDSFELRSLIVQSLRSDDIEVRSASDAHKAIEMIDKHEYDLIIVYAGLHQNSGFELIYDLKSYDDTAKIPILLLADDPHKYNEIVSQTSLGIKAVLPRLNLNHVVLQDLVREVQFSESL